MICWSVKQELEAGTICLCRNVEVFFFIFASLTGSVTHHVVPNIALHVSHYALDEGVLTTLTSLIMLQPHKIS